MRLFNDELAAKILEASKKEFLKKGFQNASVRSIAASVGVTTGAVYRYYENKEAMFDALVSEPAENLYCMYRNYSEAFSENTLDKQLSSLLNKIDSDIQSFVNYIYQNYDAFKLIACCAEGTKYSDYVERLIEVETKSSTVLVHMMKEQKNACPNVDDQLIHIISSMYFSGVFEVIAHDEPIDQAMKHIAVLKTFYTAGWYKILGII